ncbi:beta-ketoacyl-ACP synthase II [Aerosticca soli]|uniref:3-oxoacyl-[acyl-carrier-protein] synthase 2 n=1 Tax=Aerosticca soli TaxID=2010829 RepID=A0A2Z6E6E2_9GAMM|nr:beta-ketoacyl-ACP synthase II [Aerosticca soli]BBD80234.1 3-oxoacyl-[acyl-carrier-protein] synthase, KASII [Aerosticca soli]
MSKRRVVVTGMGIISPVGNDLSTAWKNILDGVSGIGPVTHFDTTGYATRIAGEVRDFDPTQWIAPKEVKKMDPFIHYGIAAGVQAIRDAGLEVRPDNAARIGVAVGAGIGGLSTIEATTIEMHEKGPRRVSPFFVPSSIINMVSGHLSIMFGIKGPNIACVTACATATHNLGLAMRMIQYGDADVMLAGGAEYATTGVAMAGFCSAKAMSTRNDEPTRASRPWDKDRDGFVLSDGAGVLVLEEYEHARARGARIYAELIGFGMSGDAYHITAPSEGGEGAARCMQAALDDAGIAPTQVQYINAHGTSTPLGDLGEVQAAKKVFGEHAYKLAMSSTKSTTGHLLGAAGGVEAIFTILAMRDQVLPPTINLDEPGEGCDLDFVPNMAREARIEIAISNSFGFGGTNGTLAFRRL